MESKDIADLFLTATGKIEFYWNFYTVTLLALVGWLVSTDLVLDTQMKTLITAGYLAFVVMNLIGLWGSYTFAEALRQDLLIAAKADANTLTNAREVLSRRSLTSQKTMAVVIHTLIGTIFLYGVWF